METVARRPYGLRQLPPSPRAPCYLLWHVRRARCERLWHRIVHAVQAPHRARWIEPAQLQARPRRPVALDGSPTRCARSTLNGICHPARPVRLPISSAKLPPRPHASQRPAPSHGCAGAARNRVGQPSLRAPSWPSLATCSDAPPNQGARTLRSRSRAPTRGDRRGRSWVELGEHSDSDAGYRTANRRYPFISMSP